MENAIKTTLRPPLDFKKPGPEDPLVPGGPDILVLVEIENERVLADLASLPLDIVAQGKGFARTAPNPIGLKKIT